MEKLIKTTKECEISRYAVTLVERSVQLASLSLLNFTTRSDWLTLRAEFEALFRIVSGIIIDIQEIISLIGN